MDSHNEDFKYLKLGKRTYEVSNIPAGKKHIARTQWNELVGKEGYTTEELFNLIEEIGIELVKQPLKVLLRRYFPLKAIYQYIKRLFLTKKYLKSLPEKDYEVFEDFVSLEIMGKKKATLERQKGIIEIIDGMLQSLEEKTSLDQSACLKLLQTSVEGTVEGLMNSIQDPKK